MVPNPSAPLPYTILLQHRHQIIISHLSGLEPSINGAAGSRTEETVGEVVVDPREMRLENKRFRYKKENKGAAE